MTPLKLIFLDTSVFAGQQYNFGSAALSSFVEIAQEKGLSLVLPAPTSSEVERQIKARSDEALKALDEARRKAPFLKKWKHWPEKPTSANPEGEVRRIAVQEWRDFLSQFEVIKLSYEDVKLDKIMRWYDLVRAPFREGKKRKEFPDAFAIESLAQFAAKEQDYIAVVSEDQDFKLACEHFGSLLYFPSLPKLTETLLSQDANFDALRDLILENSEILLDLILDEIYLIGFYPHDSDIEISDSEITEFDLGDIQIVGIGATECTVVFNGVVRAKHELSWTEWEGPHADEPYVERDSSRQSAHVSGTAKIQIKKTEVQPFSVSFIELDQDEIRVETPSYRRYRPF